MTDKNTYWIADLNGVKAQVVGADARDYWTKVNGWSETTEPTGYEFQWVRNVDHGGKGVLNHEAALLHEALGWMPSGPEGYDEPADEPEPEPAKSSPKSAPVSAGDKKE
jgi:hypothetical protein